MARCVSLAMAVLLTGTVVHIPFPVAVQRKSLEADGLAVLRLQSTGDGSGGNVLHTFRGQAGFLYSLRFISAKLTEVTVSTGPDVEVRLDAQWLADATGQAAGDFSRILSMATSSPVGATPERVAGGSFPHELEQSGGLIFLGTIQRSGVFDIMAMSHRGNDLNNTYVSYAVFDAYRTEALTVPGILNQLRSGLVR